jgi:membrane protein
MKRKEAAKSGLELLKRTYKEFDEDNAIKLSASLSYYIILYFHCLHY